MSDGRSTTTARVDLIGASALELKRKPSSRGMITFAAQRVNQVAWARHMEEVLRRNGSVGKVPDAGNYAE